MAWYEIPNTNAVSIYASLTFGVLTVIFVFRLWLKATCGKFTSDVSLRIFLNVKQIKLRYILAIGSNGREDCSHYWCQQVNFIHFTKI